MDPGFGLLLLNPIITASCFYAWPLVPGPSYTPPGPWSSGNLSFHHSTWLSAVGSVDPPVNALNAFNGDTYRTSIAIVNLPSLFRPLCTVLY
ncbi:hypothetical protein NXS19_013579 [Fusarium pseudograminearum]|nr:hypothetical protein NXS19_013579 [Fusarium pseudograminearum]